MTVTVFVYYLLYIVGLNQTLQGSLFVEPNRPAAFIFLIPWINIAESLHLRVTDSQLPLSVHELQ